MVTYTLAKTEWRLSDRELALLPHEERENPHHPFAAPMKLYLVWQVGGGLRGGARLCGRVGVWGVGVCLCVCRCVPPCVSVCVVVQVCFVCV
jgi:hypothetical protein